MGDLRSRNEGLVVVKLPLPQQTQRAGRPRIIDGCFGFRGCSNFGCQVTVLWCSLLRLLVRRSLCLVMRCAFSLSESMVSMVMMMMMMMMMMMIH